MSNGINFQDVPRKKCFLVSIYNDLKQEYGAPMPLEHMNDAYIEFARFLLRSDIAPFRDSFTLCVYGEFDLIAGVLTRYDDTMFIDPSDQRVVEFMENLQDYEKSKRGAAVGGVNPPQVAERPDNGFA